MGRFSHDPITFREVYKAINGMSPDFLQDLFVIKANVHDLRDNNKMKLYKFRTMTYGKHSIKYVADILWNSINEDIKIDNLNVFKRKIRNWQLKYHLPMW